MAESWFATKKNEPYTKTSDTMSPNSLALSYKKIFEKLANFNGDSTVKYPPAANSIDDAAYVTAFLVELKRSMFESDLVESVSLIVHRDLATHLCDFLKSVSHNHKHLVYRMISEIFATNQYNKKILTEHIPFHCILRDAQEAPEDSTVEKTSIQLLCQYAAFTITKEQLCATLKSLMREQVEPNKKRAFLKVLNCTCDKEDPDHILYFAPLSGKTISIECFPQIEKKLEYTISSWFNLRNSPYELQHTDSVRGQSRTANWTPYLFSFSTDDGVSLALYFAHNSTVVECWNGEKMSSNLFSHELETDKWHLITLVHQFTPQDAQITLYFDGEQVGTCQIGFPNTRKRFTKCFIGHSGKNNQSHLFFGAISAFYMWHTALISPLVAEIYKATQFYQGIFNSISDHPQARVSPLAMRLFNCSIIYSSAFSYLPQCTSRNVLHNASSVYSQSNGECYDAVLHKRVSVVSTKGIDAALKSSGTVSLIIGMISRVLVDRYKGIEQLSTLTIDILRFCTRLACKCKSLTQHVNYNVVYFVISYQVNQFQNTFFTKDLMECILECCKEITQKTHILRFMKEILKGFIFNLYMWEKWDQGTLQYALDYMVSERIDSVDFAHYIKKCIGVEPITKVVIAYYNGEDTKNDQERVVTKSYLMALIKNVIIQESGLKESELENALYYFGPKKEEYIYNMVNIMKESALKEKKKFGQAFCNLNAIVVLNELLSSPDQSLFEDGLEFFTLLVSYSPPEPLNKLIITYHIWSILSFHLLKRPFTERIYHYILRMLVGDQGFAILHGNNIELIKTVALRKCRVIQVMTWLMQHALKELEKSGESADGLLELSKDFIKKLTLVCEVSATSRLKLHNKVGWQGWLLDLLRLFIGQPCYEQIKSQIFVIITHISITGLTDDPDGWAVFFDLLGYLHFHKHYSKFDSIYALLTTEHEESQEVINRILSNAETSTKSNEPTGQEETASENKKNKKHTVGVHLPMFHPNLDWLKFLSGMFSQMVEEFQSLRGLNRVINSSSSTLLLKNMAVVIYSISNFILNEFGSALTLQSIATSSNALSENNFVLSTHEDPSVHAVLANILHTLYTLFDMLYVSSDIPITPLEVEVGLGEGLLLMSGFKLCMYKILLETSANCFNYWTIMAKNIDIRATPLYGMNELVLLTLSEYLKFMQSTDKKNEHPLLRQLLLPSYYRFLKQLINRQGEDVQQQRNMVSAMVYVFSTVCVAHYKRTIEHTPQANSEFFSEMDVQYFIEKSLSGMTTLMYETMIKMQDFFNQNLVSSTKESLLEVGLKKRKSATKIPLQFVMLLSSVSWSKTIESKFKDSFVQMSEQTKTVALELKEQINTRSCMAADISMYSALFVQKSMYHNSRWKTSLENLNKMIIKKTTEIETFSLEKEEKVRRKMFYENTIEKHLAFTDALLFSKIENRKNTDISYRVMEREDFFRRRFVQEKKLSRVKVEFLKKECRLGSVFVKTLNIDTIIFSDFRRKAQFESENSETGKMDPNFMKMLDMAKKPGDYMSNMASLFKKVRQEVTGGRAQTTVTELFSASIVKPGIVVPGTIKISQSEQTFAFQPELSKLPNSHKEFLKALAFTDILIGFNQILQIFVRYYAHQQRGVEIFTIQKGSLYLLLQNKKDVKELVNLLPEVGVGFRYGLPQKREVSFYSPKMLFERSIASVLWTQSIMSNFDYIMFLNTISGRTYQDISQYPIFPWVLSNYETDSIDLTNVNNYRDLSKPIANSNTERVAIGLDRFMSHNDEGTPPGHYDAYCSNPDYVTDYLIRLRPFVVVRSFLGQKKMDHPSNLFTSMRGMWERATSKSLEIRELTPEFFYLPELYSSNTVFFDTETNENFVLPKVQLPPYAKSELDFVNIHSMALESTVVSSTLHKWIDYTFGFSQRGKEGEKIINLYNYLTYDSPLNNYEIKDSQLISDIKDFIFFNGQAPRQLTNNPHPIKNILQTDQSISKSGIDKRKVFIDVKDLSPGVPIIYIGFSLVDDKANFLIINQKLNMYMRTLTIVEDPVTGLNMILTPTVPDNDMFHFDVQKDDFSRCSSDSFLATPSGRAVVSACPYWDCSLRVYLTHQRALDQLIRCQVDQLTCVDCEFDIYSHSCVYMVTGSRDSTISLWSFYHEEERIGLPEDVFSRSKYKSEVVMYGHIAPVTNISIRNSVGLIASSSESGHVCIHSFESKLLRMFSVVNTPDSKIQKLMLLFNGTLLILTTDSRKSVLSLYSREGSIIHQRHIPEVLDMLCLNYSGTHCFVSGSENVVVVIKLSDFGVVYTYAPFKTKIVFILDFAIGYLAFGTEAGQFGLFSTEGWAY